MSNSIMNDVFRILKNLPIYGKVFAIVSLIPLYFAINPSYEKPYVLHGHHNKVVERDGKLDFRLPPMFVKEFPQDAEYVNTGNKPEPGEEFALIETVENDGSHKYYLYKHQFGHSHSEWMAAIEEHRKAEKRTQMLFLYVVFAAIAFCSYPGVIQQLLSFIPKGGLK